eukprot:scaffold5443_cov291-Pinguiococcus_pyrenoidosus.AAC.19
MTMNFLLLVSRQGKVRLAKFYNATEPKEQARVKRQVTAMVLLRPLKNCNFCDYGEIRVVYKRYASLYFIMGIDQGDNELLALETIHCYVEALDRFFGNVCELDLIFNFHKAYFILDEFFIGGHIQETSKREILRRIAQMDALMEEQLKKEEEEAPFAVKFPSIG